MTLRTKSRVVTRAAFTLMEMLVVVAILVVLAGAAIPIYLSYLDGARRDRAKIDIANLERAVDAFAAQHGGQYPQQWADMLQPGDSQRAPLEQKSLMDPWNKEYVYDPSQTNPTTMKPKIYTTSPSGTMISNW